MRRLLMAGATLAFALAGSQAAAATYLVTKTQIVGSVNAHIVGPGVDRNVRLGVMNFTVEGMVDPVELFCIDPYHTIPLGIRNPALSYHTEAFTHDFGGNMLSLDTRQEIAWLANHGVRSNSLFEERAVQGAIWMEEGFMVSVSDAALQTRMSELHALTNRATHVPDAWVSDSGRQSFIPGGAVPEPATWALMIGGFGGAGVMLRRRRATLALT